MNKVKQTGSHCTVAIPHLDIDPFDVDILTNPYDYYEILRESGPIVWLDKYKLYATGRHEEVQQIFMDWENFCSSRGVGINDFKKEKPWRKPSLVLEADPPEHTRARMVLARAMSPKAVRDLKQGFIDYANVLVEELIEKKSFDGVTELAAKFPLKVFPDAVGLKEEGRDNLLPYGSMVFNALGPRNAIFEQAMENTGPVIEWITKSCQRDMLAPGGFGASVHAEASAGEITDEEAQLLVRSLLSAGIDTTVNGIGNTLLCLARNPEQWSLLSNKPELARNAFEEGLRYESPAHSFFRTTSRTVRISGHDLEEGHKILLCMAAANRDPRYWENPDEYKIDRKVAGHLAFGTGIHGCVGQNVSRLEAEVLLGTLAEKVKTIELEGEPVFKPGNTLRSLSRLPMSIKPK